MATESDILLENRIVLVRGMITDSTGMDIIASLLYLNHGSLTEPIHLYIDSPGGSVPVALAIMHTMDSIEPPVHTYCIGDAVGIAINILAHGEKGFRTALPLCTLTFAQIWTKDVSDNVEEQLNKDREVVIDMLAEDTTAKKEELRDYMAEQRTLDPDEALMLGIVDRIEEQRL